MMSDKKGWTIKRYDKSDAEAWDEFVRESRNGTFLFLRGYMDYHSDRFEDCSLMAYLDGNLSAMLPANVKENTLYSHQGLTYGGWMFPQGRVDAGDVGRLFEAMIEWGKASGIRDLIYKPVPYIYHRRPSQEDVYWLWRSGAELTACNLSASLETPMFSKSQRRSLKLALRNEVEFVADADVESCYALLEQSLQERYGVKPVHSLSELKLLHERFPENIRFYKLVSDAGIEAQVCIYLNETCAHCQYIATTAAARRAHLYTLIIARLLEQPEIQSRKYFDFGTSNEEHGKVLNETLFHNKFSFGAGGVIYSEFKLKF